MAAPPTLSLGRSTMAAELKSKYIPHLVDGMESILAYAMPWSQKDGKIQRTTLTQQEEGKLSLPILCRSSAIYFQWCSRGDGISSSVNGASTKNLVANVKVREAKKQYKLL